MDPNVTLRETLELIVSPFSDEEERLCNLESASQLFYNLHAWLSDGGFLPLAWQDAQVVNGREENAG